MVQKAGKGQEIGSFLILVTDVMPKMTGSYVLTDLYRTLHDPLSQPGLLFPWEMVLRLFCKIFDTPKVRFFGQLHEGSHSIAGRVGNAL